MLVCDRQAELLHCLNIDLLTDVSVVKTYFKANEVRWRDGSRGWKHSFWSRLSKETEAINFN